MWPSGRTGYAAICGLMRFDPEMCVGTRRLKAQWRESARPLPPTNRRNSIESRGDGTIATGAARVGQVAVMFLRHAGAAGVPIGTIMSRVARREGASRRFGVECRKRGLSPGRRPFRAESNRVIVMTDDRQNVVDMAGTRSMTTTSLCTSIMS